LPNGHLFIGSHLKLFSLSRFIVLVTV